MEAKRRGATIIHVDLRLTRTSAAADIHVPIRAGSAIVFLGGIIRYVIGLAASFAVFHAGKTSALHPRAVLEHPSP